MKKFFALEERLTLLDLQHEKQRMSEGLLEYIRRFRDISLLCYNPVEEERLVDVCTAGMLYEYQPYLQNLQISSFTTCRSCKENKYVRKEAFKRFNFTNCKCS